MDGANKEVMLNESATRATQLLINKIFNCPTEPSDAGPLAVLPSELFKLPREKRIPEVKPETKWEKFAREKGIKNKKRERMIFDEETEEYRPRFGYKRANNGIEDIPIVEVKSGQDPFADPWAEERKEKKARVTKNNKQQLKNQRRNGSYTPESVPGLPIDLINKVKKRGKEGIKQALQLAQHSTASLGRFDEMRKGEPVRKVKGKKQSFRANILSSHDDIATMKSNLRIVNDKVEKKIKGVTNSLAAYEGIIPDAPTDKFKQKKGKGKVTSQGKRKK
jgi:regulator of ribosome biosynthesis